jgi:hypothetical protein
LEQLAQAFGAKALPHFFNDDGKPGQVEALFNGIDRGVSQRVAFRLQPFLHGVYVDNESVGPEFLYHGRDELPFAAFDELFELGHAEVGVERLLFADQGTHVEIGQRIVGV